MAALGIPVGVALIYLGSWSVAGILSLVAALGTLEFFRLAGHAGAHPFRLPGTVASVLLVLGAAWADGPGAWALSALVILLVLSLVALGAAVFLRSVGERPLASTATTVFGPIYLGVTLGFGVHLRAFPGVADGAPGWEGASVLIFPMAVAWLGDAAAYFAGRRWGRTKLIPRVSPGKTVAGAVGGLLVTVVVAVLMGGVLLGPYTGLGLSIAEAALIGFVIAGVSQIGDLAESLLKREAGIKDSGTLFPGHGGVLDRFDSILFALPVTYLLLGLLAG